MHEYERGLLQPREEFAAIRGLNRLLADDLDPRLLELFLIYFSALGVRMTSPVEGWLRRASERCRGLGMQDFATALNGHASAESGHHLMMIADTKALCARWNGGNAITFVPEALLSLPATEGAARYIQIHESIIEGPMPYVQFALEYEIEMLPVKYGSRIIQQCIRLLSPEITPCLSFLTEHVELDVGHTRFNTRQMERLIGERPDALPHLIDAGSSILNAYGQFLCDCMSAAQTQWERASLVGELR